MRRLCEMMNDDSGPQWWWPAELRPTTEPPRLTDAVRLALVLERLLAIEDIVCNGIPRRPGSKSRLPWRERDRIILEHIRAALST